MFHERPFLIKCNNCNFEDFVIFPNLQRCPHCLARNKIEQMSTPLTNIEIAKLIDERICLHGLFSEEIEILEHIYITKYSNLS